MTLAKNGFEQIHVECELYSTFIQVIFIRAFTSLNPLICSLWFMIYASSSCIITMIWTKNNITVCMRRQ